VPGKGIETLLALDHYVAIDRLHSLADLGVPRALREERVVVAARQDAEVAVRVVRRICCERDRRVDHLRALGTCRLAHGDRVGEHVVLGHNWGDGRIELAALGGKLVTGTRCTR